MRHQRLSFLGLTFLVGSGGCGHDGVTGPSQPTVKSATALMPPPTPDKQIGTFYLHDFGMVLPGQVARHRFSVTNSTNSPWTFAKLIPSCSCTVASTSAPVIAPSKTETVEVEYKAPRSNGNDRRKVGVQFAEADAPMFWLEIQARIRQPISFFPEAITLSQVGKDVTESFFEVHNFSTSLIELKEPRCSEPWLEAELRPIAGTSPEVKQVWRVVVRARTRNLKPGKHTAEVLVAESGTDFQKKVPIEVDLIAPVRPIPSRLFFGSLDRGRSVERRLSLLLSADLPGLQPSDIQIKHDLGGQLAIHSSRSSSTRLEIAATMTPAATDLKDINGTIELTFPDPALPPISIPVIAAVNP